MNEAILMAIGLGITIGVFISYACFVVTDLWRIMQSWRCPWECDICDERTLTSNLQEPLDKCP